MYRKPTHTDHYLQSDSHHPLIHKLGVFRTLNHREQQVISDPHTLINEKNNIKQSLWKCGYPDWLFSGNQKYQNKWGCGIDNIKEEHKPWVTIPYIQGLSENIKNILKENGVTTFYKPQNTRDHLTKAQHHGLKQVILWWFQLKPCRRGCWRLEKSKKSRLFMAGGNHPSWSHHWVSDSPCRNTWCHLPFWWRQLM